MIPIFINLCLAGMKFFAGSICGLTSITADAANNLMDAITSTFTELGAMISAVPGGKRHKNGHGRFEWLVAMAMSCSIVVVGWGLFRESINAIGHPSEARFHPVTLVILIVSVAVKVFLFLYNSQKAREHNSQVYKAAALDCVSDAVSTTAVLISFIIQSITGAHLDGYCGALVSLFIMYNGIKSFADTSGRIIGDSIDEEALNRLETFIRDYGDGVIAKCADVQIADYGYGRFGAVASVIPAPDRTDKQVLDDITGLRSGIFKAFGYFATIQPMMPIDASADLELRKELESYLNELPYSININEETSLNRSGKRTQIVLHAEVPFEEGKQEKDIVSAIERFTENREVDLIVKLSVRNDHRRHWRHM